MTKQSENLQIKVTALEASLQEAQRQITTLEIVQEVTRSLTSELNLDPLLHKILAAAVKVINASAGSLLLLDPLTNELIFAVVEGGGGEILQGVRIAGDTGLAGWVATHQKPLIIDDVSKDKRYDQRIATTFNIEVTSLLCVPMISHKRLIGVLQMVHTQPERHFGQTEQTLLTTFASEAAITIENARLYESLKEERDKLLAVEDEIRKQLARDLHDGPTQFVSAIIMRLSLIETFLQQNSDQTIAEVQRTKGLAEQALKQLRNLLFDLRPVILETQGLVPALEIYSERLQETEQLNLILTVEGEFARLSAKAEIAIFAVIQEAVNNAKKHAETNNIHLRLQTEQNQDKITISIKDEGPGFDIQIITAGYDKRGSLGMINMQERAEAINGTFQIRSEVGQNTEVILTLPLNENLLSNSKEI